MARARLRIVRGLVVGRSDVPTDGLLARPSPETASPLQRVNMEGTRSWLSSGAKTYKPITTTFVVAPHHARSCTWCALIDLAGISCPLIHAELNIIPPTKLPPRRFRHCRVSRLTHAPTIMWQIQVWRLPQDLATKLASMRCHQPRSCAASCQSISTAIEAPTCFYTGSPQRRCPKPH